MMNLLCLFGFHDWASTKICTLRFDLIGNVRIHQVGRTFWDNTCQRCGKVVELTYRYARGEEDK